MLFFDAPPPAIIRPAPEDIRRFGGAPDLAFLPGFAVKVPRSKIKFEATDISSNATNLTNYSFASQNVGEATADRLVVVAAFTTGAGQSVTSISIGGSAATSIANAFLSSFSGRMATRVLSSGTTTTVDVACSGSVGRCQVIVFTLKQYRSIVPYDTYQEAISDASVDHSASVDVQGNGIAVYAAMKNAAATGQTWAGATEVLVENVPSEGQRSCLAYSLSPGAPRTATVTWPASGNRVIMAGSWR